MSARGTPPLETYTQSLMCSSLARYALITYPWVKVQFIVYGEDKGMIEGAGAGEALPIRIALEAQARWSSFANVVWCIANDVGMELAINAIGGVMAANEPWGTLITSYVVARGRERTGRGARAQPQPIPL